MRSPFPWQTILIEVFSIVFGVLLALALNQWREERAQAALTAAALENVSHELRSNLEFLEKLHARNRSAVDAATSGAGTAEEQQIVPGLQLRDTAWRTLITAGMANRVPYETLLVLSETYSVQDVYKQIGSQLTGAAMNAAAFATVSEQPRDPENFTREFMSYFHVLLLTEEQLLKEYRTAIDAL
jgi:hypothetical protein